jgi:hypothetical protein
VDEAVVVVVDGWVGEGDDCGWVEMAGDCDPKEEADPLAVTMT